MRVSLLRLWISVGFALLGLELALLIFVLIRTREDAKEMRKSLEALKTENAGLKRESQFNRQELERLRRAGIDKREATSRNENKGTVEKGANGGAPIDAGGLVRDYREAVEKGDRGKARDLEQRLRDSPNASVSALIAAIGGETSITVRAALYTLLGQIDSQEALTFLRGAILDEKDRTIRLAVAVALARSADETFFSTLQQALRGETDPDVRLAIMKAIAKSGTDDAAVLLAAQYQQSPEKDRSPILEILSGMKQLKLKEFFQGILADSKVATDRVLAVRGLGNVGDKALLPDLEALKTSDPEESVRLEADRAILKIRGR